MERHLRRQRLHGVQISSIFKYPSCFQEKWKTEAREFREENLDRNELGAVCCATVERAAQALHGKACTHEQQEASEKDPKVLDFRSVEKMEALVKRKKEKEN